MPQRCAAVGCTNASGKQSGVRFFRFPASSLHAARRSEWVKAMRRINTDRTPWQPSANSRVCSSHFLNGKKPSRFPDHPDYVPSLFTYKKTSRAGAIARFERLKKRQSGTQAAVDDCPDEALAGTQAAVDDCPDNLGQMPMDRGLDDESTNLHSLPADENVQEPEALHKGCQADDQSLNRIRQLEALLATQRRRTAELGSELACAKENIRHWQTCYYDLKSTTLRLENMHTTEDMLYYTGLPSPSIFQHILCLVLERNPHLGKSEEKRANSAEEEMFMVLVRLRTGMATKEIVRNFQVSMATFSRIFSQWVLVLQKELTAITSFPTLAEVQQHIPPHFRQHPNTRIVLDTTEIRIQKPSSFNAQKHTFSPYKHTNTMKCLVGATPDCYICFVSSLYGGGTSDRAIVQQSAVLDLLEPGDGVMVDKGFKIDDLLPPGVSRYMPPFRVAGEAQMSKKDVEETKHVASARVHIERVIRRIKEYHILDRPFPINMIDLADAIFTTCAFLSNFRGPLINCEKDDAKSDSE
ncbi:unnamed protein product [Ixodes hexagonus]